MISGLAWLVTWFGFRCLGIRRKLVDGNIQRALPNIPARRRRQIAIESVYHNILTFMEFLRAIRLDTNLPIEGFEHIQDALKEGRGCYILCPHLGDWEASARATATALLPHGSYALVKPVGSKRVNELVTRIRSRSHFFAIDRDTVGDGVRGIGRLLADNNVIFYVGDQHRPGGAVVDFFGQPARTSTTLAVLWQRHPAPVIPGFSRRLGVGTGVGWAGKPLDLGERRPGQTRKERTLELTEIFNRAMEDMIRQCPEQYFWLHDRWKVATKIVHTSE